MSETTNSMAVWATGHSF